MTREPPRLLAWAAGLSIAAALVHGLLTEEHFAEWWAYGAFFAFATTAQAIYGVTVVGTRMMHGETIAQRWPRRARRAFYLSGIAGNLFLVVFYVFTRTIAIPLGPAAGETEAWSALGVVTKIVELGLVGVLVALYRRVPRPAG